MIITTSRKPSRRTRSLGRDLERVLPFSRYVTRGKASIQTLVDKCINQGQDRIILLSDVHGNPGMIQAIVVKEGEWYWHPIKINLKGVRLQREIGKKSKLDSIRIRNETSYKVGDLFTFPMDWPDSENIMLVREDLITFFVGEREVGPKLRIRSWEYAEDRD